MNMIRRIQTFELSSAALRNCGIAMMAAGVIATGFQGIAFGAGDMTNMQLLEAMEANSAVLGNVTTILALRALEACALPIFSFLLVQGTLHTSDFGKYLLRILGMAVLSEIPYNLAMGGVIVGHAGFNPAFSLVMSMVMIYFFRRFSEKKGSHIAMKILAIVGCYLWSNILGVEFGAPCVVLTAVLWGLRDKQNLQTVVGIAVMFACCIYDMFLMMAPLSFLLIHFYGGKPGEGNRLLSYLLYPAMLLMCWAVQVLF